MRSTGEVMGIDMAYPQAYAKAALAAGQKLPTGGKVFITVMDKHKDAIVPVAQELQVGVPCWHLPSAFKHRLAASWLRARTAVRPHDLASLLAPFAAALLGSSCFSMWRCCAGL